jgi:Family of unknown function (DUF6496)
MKKKNHLLIKKAFKVMHEIEAGDLHAGKTDTIVNNPKQAIAIALSEADDFDRKNKK